MYIYTVMPLLAAVLVFLQSGRAPEERDKATADESGSVTVVTLRSSPVAQSSASDTIRPAKIMLHLEPYDEFSEKMFFVLQDTSLVVQEITNLLEPYSNHWSPDSKLRSVLILRPHR